MVTVAIGLLQRKEGKKPTQNVGLAIGSIGAVDKSGRADLEWSHNTKMRGENV